jgi:hypothetical protein
MNHFPWKETGYALGFLLLLLVLYVGSYFAMVQRRPVREAVRWEADRIYLAVEHEPDYRFGGNTLFAPIHRIDRATRRDYWAPPSERERWVPQQFQDAE